MVVPATDARFGPSQTCGQNGATCIPEVPVDNGSGGVSSYLATADDLREIADAQIEGRWGRNSEPNQKMIDR